MALSDLIFLTADHTIWVHPDGDDGAPGTDDDPVASYQGGVNLATSAYYFNNFTVRVQALREPQDDPFEFTNVGALDICHISRAWHGPGTLRLVGDTANPANVKLSASGASCFRTGGGPAPGLCLPGNLFIEGFEVAAPTNNCFGIRHAARCDLAVGFMRYGPCGTAHYGNEWAPAHIRTHGPSTVFGSAQQHVHCDVGTMMIMHAVTVVGSLTFDQWCDCQHNGYAMFIGSGQNYDLTGGSVTGSRYRARTAGRIQGRANPSTWALPGTTNGVVDTGGLYFVA